MFRPHVIFAAMVTLFVSAVPLRGETYHSNRFGYSVSLPNDCTRIPANVLQEAMARAFRPGSSTQFEVEVVFQRRSDPWFEGPYVVIMVFGTGAQLSEGRIDEVVKMLTGIEPEQIKSSMSAATRASTDVRSTGRVLLDKARRRYLWEVETQTSDEPWILRTYGFIGRRSIVHLCCYDRQGRPAQLAEALVSSFAFDAATAYDDSLQSQQAKWTQRIGTVIGVAVVLWIMGLWRKVSRKRKGPVERPPTSTVERDP